MSAIERTIQVSYRHQVHFTQGVFNPENPLLKDVLVNNRPGPIRKAIVVVDDALAAAQPNLLSEIEAYFAAFPGNLKLVSTLVVEGGERAKNSYFHVSEIHSHVDKFHVDRHSYIIAVGGGALLDVVGDAIQCYQRERARIDRYG